MEERGNAEGRTVRLWPAVVSQERVNWGGGATATSAGGVMRVADGFVCRYTEGGGGDSRMQGRAVWSGA